MSESTRRKILYAALVGAIIWGVYNFVPKSPLNTTTTSKQEDSRQAPQADIRDTFARVEQTCNGAHENMKGGG